MYERLNRSAPNALAYRVARPLSRQEMARLTTELEGAISAAGKIRILLDLQAFPYAEVGAFWEDLKFDLRHAAHLERLALVGGSELARWSTRAFAALSRTSCRCFEPGELDAAWRWLTGA